MLNKLYHKGAEIKSAFLNGVKVFGTSEVPVEPSGDIGLAKDYSGEGWYKATDTGIVYNKGVPEGETHTFEGDPTEYISVWRNEGIDLETFQGTEEDIQKLVYWHKNLHRFATSNVTDMSYWVFGHGYNDFYEMLGIPPFDIPSNDISHYDTSNVTNMLHMFNIAISFNSDISMWDVSSVTSMSSMFQNATVFNSDISSWDVSSVTRMANMFLEANSFNSDLSSWDTSKVTDMSRMFENATSFNQDLSGWCVSLIPTKPYNFDISASAWTLPRPVWGTCPRGENTSD